MPLNLIRWPVVDVQTELLNWAQATTRNLQRFLGQEIDPPQVGQMVLFKNPPGVPSPGWLPCDGSSFKQATYPALWQFLGAGTTPVLAGPAGFVYGIKT